MNRFFLLPLSIALVSCGSADNEIASGEFDDGDGNSGSFSVTGDDDNSETVIKSGDGEVRIATGTKAVEDLPMGIDLYPGAEIQTSMSGAGDGKSGAMIIFKTDDEQQNVIDFYKDQMKSKGIAIKTDLRVGDMQMIGGERSDGEGLNLSVTKDNEGGTTTTLIAGEGN